MASRTDVTLVKKMGAISARYHTLFTDNGEVGLC